MLRFAYFLLSLNLLTACSLYSSTGRKQFEEKAPSNNLVQSYSLIGCRDLSTAETWLKEEFPSPGNELVEMNPEYEVWAKPLKDTSLEIAVLSKHEAGGPGRIQSCNYQFVSREEWRRHKKSFLNELAKSLVNLD